MSEWEPNPGRQERLRRGEALRMGLRCRVRITHVEEKQEKRAPCKVTEAEERDREKDRMG